MSDEVFIRKPTEEDYYAGRLRLEVWHDCLQHEITYPECQRRIAELFKRYGVAIYTPPPRAKRT